MSQQVVHIITIGLYVTEVCRSFSRKGSMKNVGCLKYSKVVIF